MSYAVGILVFMGTYDATPTPTTHRWTHRRVDKQKHILINEIQ